MHCVLGEISGCRGGNESKKCVDLYEYLLIEGGQSQYQGGQSKGERKLSPFFLNRTSRAAALCFGCGDVIHSQFDSWHHPFHFASLSFYFSPCPHHRTSCTCSIPHSQTLDPHGCFGWVSASSGGYMLRTRALFQNRLVRNVSSWTNG